MKYYYHLNGTNLGPMTERELLEAEALGMINDTTPVIEEGGKAWKRWSQVRAEHIAPAPEAQPYSPAPAPETRSYSPAPAPSAGMASAPSVTTAMVLAKLLSFNTAADKMLSKVYRLPSFVPKDAKGQQAAMDKLANITALCIWLGYIISGIAMVAGSRGSGSGPIILTILICVLGGAIMQYFQYHFYSMTNALLFGNKITLSGPALPRLQGASCLIAAVVFLLSACFADSATDVIIGLCGMAIFKLMVYLFINAEVFFVRISPSETTPGRELNNFVRLTLRALIISVQLALPLCCLLTAIALCFNPPSMLEMAFNPEVVLAPLAIYNMPFIVWLVLCLSSWLLDLYDSICSLGTLSKKNADSEE